MAAEPETYQPELLTEEEPKYLRRQRPVEIRKRKLGRRSWAFYRRVILASVAAIAAGWTGYEVWDFFNHSPRVILARPEQVELVGNHFVGREAVLEKFVADFGRSVMRAPLGERRRALEQMPWVEQASVERLLPNRIRVELTERTPIGFLRTGTDLALVDPYGVILERPADELFRFPVVTGLSDAQPRELREQRMRLYEQFLKEIEAVRPGSSAAVSEADLSDANDLRAVLTGLAGTGGDSGAVTVHFGEGDFAAKYRMLMEYFAQWQANTGRVESVDLRYSRQVVINPEAKAAHSAPAEAPGNTKRR